jgi:hypothetical protein
MRIKLERRWTKHLLRLPKSGMGYQRVDLRLADGRELKNALGVSSFSQTQMASCGCGAHYECFALHSAYGRCNSRRHCPVGSISLLGYINNRERRSRSIALNPKKKNRCCKR